jgi:hypothetical protein
LEKNYFTNGWLYGPLKKVYTSPDKCSIDNGCKDPLFRKLIGYQS